MIYVDFNWNKRKAIGGNRYIKLHPGKHNFEILQSYPKLHRSNEKYAFIYPAY